MTTAPVGERTPRPPHFLHWRVLLLPLVLLGGVAFGYWAVTALVAPQSRPVPVPEAQVNRAPIAAPAVTQVATVTASPAEFTEVSGLEILGVAISGEGGIIDVRYRVTDEKLAELHASHVAPAVIDSDTGKALETGWMGHAHPPDSFQPDRNYWMLFRNQDELVERGDLVAVRIGNAELTGVRVR